MRLAIVAIVALVAAPAPALAGPITFGADLGVTQSRVDAGSSANPTLGAFGRVGVARHLALQLSIARIEMPDGNMMPGIDMKQADAAVITELATGTIVPFVIVDAGVDRAQWQELRDRVYVHGEIGLGLDWRLAGGLVIGGDVRLGERTLVAHSEANVDTYLEPRMLSEGDYRSARLYAGVRF
jgi:hypothetical protein